MKRYALALLISLPGGLCSLLAFNAGQGEYFYPIQVGAALTFWGSGLLLGWLAGGRLPAGAGGGRVFLALLAAGVGAWILAVMAYFALNLTPLCIGQDNGDGNNDVFLCLLQSALAGLFYSPPAVILAAIAAGAGALLRRR